MFTNLSLSKGISTDAIYFRFYSPIWDYLKEFLPMLFTFDSIHQSEFFWRSFYRWHVLFTLFTKLSLSEGISTDAMYFLLCLPIWVFLKEFLQMTRTFYSVYQSEFLYLKEFLSMPFTFYSVCQSEFLYLKEFLSMPFTFYSVDQSQSIWRNFYRWHVLSTLFANLSFYIWRNIYRCHLLSTLLTNLSLSEGISTDDTYFLCLPIWVYLKEFLPMPCTFDSVYQSESIWGNFYWRHVLSTLFTNLSRWYGVKH